VWCDICIRDKTIQAPRLQFHPRIQNLTDIHLSLKETEILELGFQHNFEKSMKSRLSDPIIGTEWPSAVWTTSCTQENQTATTLQLAQLYST
jgi:hypothetical protein